jgi:hypothetical protein
MIFFSLLLILLAGGASAESVIILGGNIYQANTLSRSVTCTPISTTLVYPVPTNSPICPIRVAPKKWSGMIALSDTTHFTTGEHGGVLWLKTGPTSPPGGNFSVTITTTP